MEIDKLAWLCIKDRQVLGARSRGKTLYYIPGGKREPGESDGAALMREIAEELSVTLVAETIKYANTFIAEADGKSDGTLVKMSCYYAAFRGEIAAASEIEAVGWLRACDGQECSANMNLVLAWLKQNDMID